MVMNELSCALNGIAFGLGLLAGLFTYWAWLGHLSGLGFSVTMDIFKNSDEVDKSSDIVQWIKHLLS